MEAPKIESIKVKAMFQDDNPDTSYLMGIEAEAVVSYAINGQGNRRFETLSSGGLWGIKSDFREYLEEIKKEELDGLKVHLGVFGVDLSNWDELTEDIKIS